MEFIKKDEIISLSNPGVISKQLLCPANSSSKKITITEVHLEVGAIQPRHSHNNSEQIWYALQGNGTILLSDEKKIDFSAGDVVRFAENDIHGLLNSGDIEFIYISITSPPINFEYAYKNKKEVK